MRTGAENTAAYLDLLQGKRVGVMANHTSRIDNTHLVDSLVSLGIDIRVIFAPEHGFRGTADAGAPVDNAVDPATGIPVYSVYGGTYAPADSLMRRIDVAVFDIQDVGLRFYTYLSSMYYYMEACARHGVPLVVLDRPNPNGHIVSGPVLDMQYKSFVGIVPVPVVHGMTLGELAEMINQKGWLPEGLHTALTVIPCLGYTHHTKYTLPVKPSPNLPDNRAIYLYPSLCPFEATVVSVGRGTDFPFKVFGHPQWQGGTFTFTPVSVPGAQHPPQQDKLCHGVDLRTAPSDETIWNEGFTLKYIIEAYRNLNRDGTMGDHFFLSSGFERLVEVSYARPMISEGKSAEDIAALWQNELEAFKKERARFLIYPE